MAQRFKRGDRVEIMAGSKKGQTAKVDRMHGGRGFAGYVCLHLDGTEWDATGFAAPGRDLKKLPAS
jgi:hypothetical protein